VETSAELPFTTRPFAVAKCSAWLVSKESPRSVRPGKCRKNPHLFSGSKPSYTKICQCIAPPTIPSSSHNPAHKTSKRVISTLCSNIPRRLNKRTGMSASQVVWGTQRVASEPPGAPGCYSRNYKVVQIWPGLFVCKQSVISPGHIWTTLYFCVLTFRNRASYT
jgi:hypothetical protein